MCQQKTDYLGRMIKELATIRLSFSLCLTLFALLSVKSVKQADAQELSQTQQQKQCEAKGWFWSVDQIGQGECIKKAADSGKTCEDGSECESGFCIAGHGASEANGMCSPLYDPKGCDMLLIHGQKAKCID